MVITEETLRKNAHLSDAEITKDRDDTEREIADLLVVQTAEATIAHHHLDPNERRIYQFKSEARTGQIAEREGLLRYLRNLLVARGQ